MTITSAELNGYTQAAEGRRWLGRVVFYSMAERRVRHSLLVSMLEEQGLESFAPKPPSDADVFRRTCTLAQKKRVPTAVDGVHINILVRDVTTGSTGEIIKRIVVEEVDAAGKRLSYSESHDLTFIRSSSTLQVTRILAAHITSPADLVADAIQADYKASVGTVNGSSVRDVIRRALASHHAVSIRESGGIWFLIEEHALVVDGLLRLADKLDGLDFQSIPLIDDDRQRDMVRRAVEDESVAQIDAQVQEIQALLADGAEISAERYSTLANVYHQLTTKASAYAELLEDGLVSTQGRLDLFNRGMKALGNRIKAD